MKDSKYFIVRGTGKAISKCKGQEGALFNGEAQGTVWAKTSAEAIEIYKLTHMGYFVGKVKWQARAMKQHEIETLQEQRIAPLY